jgi:hypothetical protein
MGLVSARSSTSLKPAFKNAEAKPVHANIPAVLPDLDSIG